MFELTVFVGAKFPIPHNHEIYDETVYGLPGILTFTVNGKPIDIAPVKPVSPPEVQYMDSII